MSLEKEEETLFYSKETYLKFKLGHKISQDAIEEFRKSGTFDESKYTVGEIWWASVECEWIEECKRCKEYHHALVIEKKNPKEQFMRKKECTRSCLWYDWFKHLTPDDQNL